MSDRDLLTWRRWPRFWMLMGLWTLLGLIDAGQFYVHINYFRGRTVYWEEALASGLGDWYLWALLSPAIYSLGVRFPLDAAHWGRRLGLHVLLAAGFMLLKVALDLPLFLTIHGFDTVTLPLTVEERLLPGYEYLWPLFKLYVVVKFYIYLIVYACVVGAAHFLVYYRKYRERERLATQLEARLAQAQLQMLRMQLQPHFLFNTLNAISSLMHKDVRLADRMIARLGELLRATLDNPATQEATLRQELAFLRPYLEIEQARVGPRLTVVADVPEELLDAKLPYMLIQPLVENAIRHGIAPRCGPGRLELRVRRSDERLVLQVGDDGAGLPPPEDFREGIGLSNSRARLQGLYGEAQSLALGRRPGGGVTVTVTLPYREAAEAPAQPGPRPGDSSAAWSVESGARM